MTTTSQIAELAQMIEFSIEVDRIKERLDEMSPVLSALRHFNAAANAENVIDGLEELAADMEKVVGMLRDQFDAFLAGGAE